MPTRKTELKKRQELEMAAACIRQYAGKHRDLDRLAGLLTATLTETDGIYTKLLAALAGHGLDRDTSLQLLAAYRSIARYGYELNPATLPHLQGLARSNSAAATVFARPAVLMKAAWLFEHAPAFVFRGSSRPEERDALVLHFASIWEREMLDRQWDFSDWHRLNEVKRVRRTAFWDNTAMDPVALIKSTLEQHLEGVEISIDYHPFNYNRLLPEEFTPEKRAQIREALACSGVRLDIHSPIIGPYVPVPEPGRGTQQFFNPCSCVELQEETIQLAIELGAESVVLHLIDLADPETMARLVCRAAGSNLRVTIENYCQLGSPQTETVLLDWFNDFLPRLPAEVRERNFGITLDLGHLNLEGVDPLVGAAAIGQWCRENRYFMRMHATDNYGKLLFAPPYFSADVHANVSGRGIHNALIIKMLRSMGLEFTVVAEQIKPLSREDIETIHGAQTMVLPGSFEDLAEAGRKKLSLESGEWLRQEYVDIPAYRFLVGLHDVPELQEYAVFRRIQDKMDLSVDEAKKISGDFMRLPDSVKNGLTAYIDSLLLPVQAETGDNCRTQLDLVCQNLGSPSFWTVGPTAADEIFPSDRICHAGELICEQNQSGAEMYCIKSGRVDVFIDGNRVAGLEAGEIFGEISLFYNIPRSATVRAAVDGTRVGVLNRDDLERLFECRRPEIYDLVLRLYRTLPERLRNMNEKYRTAIRTLHLAAGAETKILEEIEKAVLAGPLAQETRALPVFSTADILRLCERRQTVTTGTIILEQGAYGDGAYFMLSGMARVTAASIGGSDVNLGEIRTGELFGEMALIDDKPRSARVQAITDCELAFIGKTSFTDLIEQRSPLAFQLLGFICSSQFKRILRLDRLYCEVKRRHRALAAEKAKPTEKGLSQDIIQTIFEHRLQQTDLERILHELSSSHRDILIGKIGDLLRRISALVEVSTRMSDTLSLDILLPRLMTIITEVLGADRSTLFLSDAEAGELFSRVAQGASVNEIRFPNHLGIAGAVYHSGQPVMIPDAYADPRFNQEMDCKTGYRTRNILCTPLRNKGKIIGVSQVLNKHEGSFDDNDLRLLEALTSQAASALENAQLYEKVEKASKEESRLLEVTNAIASELHLDTLLGKVISATTEMLDADRSTLFMFDPRTNQLWSRIAEGLEIKEIRFPSTAGIAGHCFTSGAVVNIPDAYADPRFNQEVDRKTGYRTRNILCMPVINKNGQKLAVVQVLNKRGSPFTPFDEKRLRSFSAQYAIALENAQLFEEITNARNYNESILKSLSNGVITLDSQSRVIKVNTAALKILGWQEEQVTGRLVAEIFSHEKNRWLVDSLDKVTASGTVDITMDAEIAVAGGKLVSANLTIVPLIDVKEEAIGSMVIIEDITTEKRVKSTMARYMTKEVADRLLESGEDALGGVSQMVTVLFSDIRGFTTLAEDLGPRDTVSLLNDYFTAMVDVIFEHDGILDKYMADGLMALFGAPFPGPDDADHALAVGNDMIRILAKFNAARVAAGKAALRIGVGISSGELVAGNIGSPKRMDYTVIGDPANLASRLESASKYYGVQVLFSEFTFQKLKTAFRCRPLDLIRVMGKKKPVLIYEAMDHYTPAAFPGMDQALEFFEKGLQQYRERNWNKATSLFQKVLDCHAGDNPSKLYLERCRRYREMPPPESWDGVWTMEGK